MKRLIHGLSVLLVCAATAPAFASGKVESNIEASTRAITQSNPPAEVPSPSLQNLDGSARLTSASKASVNPQFLAAAQEMKDVTGLTAQQKIAKIIQTKGQFGGGDQLRRYFFGDLEPISVQPGGAGMVVNLYNKANDVTFAYCATYDVVVAVKKGRVTTFLASEVK